jgi:hypothetical protein
MCHAWHDVICSILRDPILPVEWNEAIQSCVKPSYLPAACWPHFTIPQKVWLQKHILHHNPHRRMRACFMVTWAEMMDYCRRTAHVGWLFGQGPTEKWYGVWCSYRSIYEVLYTMHIQFRSRIAQEYPDLLTDSGDSAATSDAKVLLRRCIYNLFDRHLYMESRYTPLIGELRYISCAGDSSTDDLLMFFMTRRGKAQTGEN